MKKKTYLLLTCCMYAGTIVIAQTWSTTGNTLGATGKMGSIDFQNVNFISNNKTRGKLTNNGLWGFGNTSPLAQVHINATKTELNPLQIDVLDTAKLLMSNNGGISIGNTNLPPKNGLYVLGKVGIGTNTPDVKLHVTGGKDVSLTDGGTIVIGETGNKNLVMDRNVIQARNNGAAGTLFLNRHGGDININSGAVFFQSTDNRLGIGTTTPDAKLHVTGGGDIFLSSGGDIVAGPVNSANLAIDGNEIQARNNGEASLLKLNDNGGDVSIASGTLYINATEKQIGFGTSSPEAPLHITNGTGANLSKGGYIISGATTSSNIVIDPFRIQARFNGNASQLELNPYGGTTIVGGDLSIDGDYIFFRGNPTFQFLSTGNVASISDFLPGIDNVYSLGISGKRWTEVWSKDGTINTSDARDKKNIRDLNYGLKEIMRLHPVKFNWKDGHGANDKLGLIAQDLQKVLPEVVRDFDYKKDSSGKIEKTPAARLGVMYADIIPVLIKGMQQQQQMIEEQNKKIETLTQLVSQLANNKKINDDKTTGNVKTVTLSAASLEQNIPNPFNETTMINYHLPQNTGNAFIKITNMNGKTIKTISAIAKGSGQIVLQAGELAAGTYQYSLIVNGKLIDTKKMVLTK
jgi:hypothetical protein